MPPSVALLPKPESRSALFPSLQHSASVIAFRKELDRKAIALRRMALLVGIAVFAAFGFFDRYALLEDQWKSFLFLRFGVVCPLGLVIYLLAHVERVRPWFQEMLFGLLLVLGCVMGLMYRLAPDQVGVYYAGGTILAIFAAYTLYRFQFYWAAVSGWAIFACFDLIVLHDRVMTFDLVIWNLLFASANLCGMTVAWMMERLARIEFLQDATIDEEEKKDDRRTAFDERIQRRLRDYHYKLTQLEELRHEQRVQDGYLREGQAQLRAMMEDASDLFMETDVNGRLTMFNRAFELALGRERLEIEGTRIHDWLAEPDRSRLDSVMDEFARKGGSAGMKVTVVPTDGTRLSLELTFDAERNARNVITGFRFFGRESDGGERLRKDRSRAALWAPGDLARLNFLAGMNHEIRTAMTGILGSVHLLNESGMPKEDRELVDTIRAATERMVSVLGDVQDFIRIQEGTFALQEVPFSGPELWERLQARFSGRRNRADVRMVWDVAGMAGLGTFMGDPDRIRQAVHHLVDNAVKFTEEGEIRIHFRLAGPTGEFLEVEVADTGIGIPEDRIPALLDMSLEARSSVPSYNPRLGLSLTKLLTEAMGGGLEVRSMEGKGTTVMARFRIDRVETEAVADAKAGFESCQESGGGRRILLVEDNSINRQITVKLLERAGFDTRVAENGKEALRVLARGSFDLVLMDVELPVMDGVEATRRIRDGAAGEEARSLPVVALTAHAAEMDREACLAAGMDDFMTKPLKPELLASMVDKWCRVA